MNPARQKAWQSRLGRLRIGVEPIEVQLERYRRVTWLLTAIPAALAAFITTLFTVFRRPDIGLVLSAMLFAPIVVVAWIDFLRLRNRANRYLREQADGATEQADS